MLLTTKLMALGLLAGVVLAAPAAPLDNSLALEERQQLNEPPAPKCRKFDTVYSNVKFSEPYYLPPERPNAWECTSNMKEKCTVGTSATHSV